MKVFGKLALTLVAVAVGVLGACLLGVGVADWRADRAEPAGCWQQGR
jgi:hypothetical protein